MSDNREHVPERNKSGNAAAMREALETVRKYVKETTPDKVMLGVIEVWCDEALSAPPRNCDLGTLTEQQQRFHAFCEKMQHTDKACCGGCPIVHLRMQGVIDNSCELVWAQMPYEEGGAK